jgi:LPPG:FO 2-phospho-L-lactate transferase
MAEQLLAATGVEVSAAAVGLGYGSRTTGGLLDGWLVDEADAADVRRVVDAGLSCRAVPLLMTDLDATGAMVAAAIELVS